MTLWLFSSQERSVVTATATPTPAQLEKQASWRRTLAGKRPSRAWMFLLLSGTIFVAVLWWRWNRGWEDLEFDLQAGKTDMASRPEARVPADAMAKLVTHRVDPEYPAAAQSARLEALIALDVLVGTDGTVLNVQPLNGPPVLADAAVEALRWWRFEPYRINGRPAVVKTTVAVEFKP